MKIKAVLIYGLFGGILYALIMAGFDYASDENFNLKKFILNGAFFGFSQGALTYFTSIRQQKE